MSSTQENLMVIGIIVGMAAILGLIVGLFSSEALREEGFRQIVKRWFGR